MVLVLLIFLNSDEPLQHLSRKMKDNLIASWIQVFELLILIYEWTQLDSLSRDSVLKMELFLPVFMEKYKNTIKRTKGHGMKIIKYHMMTHLCNDILRHGPPRVYYGGVGENMLKEKTRDLLEGQRKLKSILKWQLQLGM